MKNSVIKQTMTKSPLLGLAVVHRKSGFLKKSLAASLILTSLVDAFSILVIYLLVNTTAGTENLNISKKMQLPIASESELLTSGLIVKIEDSKFYVNDEIVNSQSLTKKIEDELLKLSTEESKTLIIQADKQTEFRSINYIIHAAHALNLSKVKFAVFPKDEKS